MTAEADPIADMVSVDAVVEEVVDAVVDMVAEVVATVVVVAVVATEAATEEEEVVVEAVSLVETLISHVNGKKRSEKHMKTSNFWHVNYKYNCTLYKYTPTYSPSCTGSGTGAHGIHWV